MKDISAIILSGGKSSRMGYDKERLSYNGKYLMDIIIESLSPHFDEIIIVTNNISFYEKRYIDHNEDVIVTTDILKNMGPCAGLHSGLNISSNEDNFLIACDMPYVSHSYIDYLKNKEYKNALVYKNEDYYEPFLGLYKKHLVNDLEKYLALGKRSLNGFLKEINPDIISEDEKKMIKMSDDIFKNLNYPKDRDHYVKEEMDGFDKRI